MARDAHPLHAVRIARKQLAVGVGKAPAALRPSGEGAGRGSLRDGAAGEFTDRGAGLRRAGEVADRLFVGVPCGLTHEDQHVLPRYARAEHGMDGLERFAVRGV